jgi:hypothetical protein
MTDFFISYNSADRAWAEWIAWHLEAAGYTAVLQTWDFRPGSNFVLVMQQAAVEAERTIAVLSPAYLAARFPQPEWAAAFAQDPTGEQGLLVPVRIHECDLQGLLPQIIYIDLVGLEETAATEILLAGVRRGRAKPPTTPGFPGVAQPPRFPRTAADAEVEAEMWEMVKDSRQPEDILHFMRAYPHSHFGPLARLRLKQVQRWQQALRAARSQHPKRPPHSRTGV